MNNFFMIACRLWLQDAKNCLKMMAKYPKKSSTYAFNQLYFYWACLKLEITLTWLEYFKTVSRRK